MSDIAICFDGLLLAASLAAVSAIYLIVGLVAAAATSMTTRGRPRLLIIRRTASLFAVANFVAFLLVEAYLRYGEPPSAGPDRIDWLAVPVLILFAAGCIMLVRRRPALQRTI